MWERKRRPGPNWSWTSERDQLRVGHCLDQDRRARSDAFRRALRLRRGQHFFAVEPIDAVDAGWLALFPQQDEQPTGSRNGGVVGDKQTGAQSK